MSYDAPPPPPPEGYGQPQNYGQQPPVGPGEPPQYGGGVPKTSVLAIVSLVTGILGIPCCGCFVFGVAAAITGYLAKKEIRESGGAKTGGGLAQAGFVLGIVGIALGIVVLILRVTNVIDTTYTTDFSS